MSDSVEEIVSLVESWQHRRTELAATFSQDGLRGFAEAHNFITRKLIAALGNKQDPEFWSAWMELGQNASSMIQGGKLFVNKVDRTNT